MYLTLGIKAIKSDAQTYAYGQASLMLYEIPTIVKFFPVYATFNEQPKVEVTVDQLPFIHDVKCWFGDTEAASVSVFRQGKSVICQAPVIVSSNSTESVKINISVDGVNKYSSTSDFTFIKTPSFTGVDTLSIPLTSKAYITVQGTDFYNTGDYLACRMKFSVEGNFDLKAEYVSSTEIRCLNPPSYMVPTTNVELYVTFNRFDYSHTVTTLIQYVDVPEVHIIDKFYGRVSVNTDVLTITGEGLTSATLVSVSDFSTDLVFTSSNDTTGSFTLPAFGNISSVSSNPYTYLCSYDDTTNVRYSNHISDSMRAYLVFDENSPQRYKFYITTRDDDGWTCSDRYPRSPIEVGIANLGYSTNGISFQYYSEPEIIYISPQSVFKDSAVDLVVSGSGFWDTGQMSCRITFGSTSNILLISATFLNSTDIV